MPPRIAPGGRSQTGSLNALIARTLGLAAGTPPPNLFTTLARHRRLFRRWLRFAGALMPSGTLPRADTELVILRVAHLCRCEYEWSHHQRLAGAAGLSAEQIERVTRGPGAAGWDARQAALLSVVDELHERREIADETWAQLCAHVSGVEQQVELLMLAGHYEMLAMTINGLRIEPDRPAGRSRSPVARGVRALARRRSA